MHDLEDEYGHYITSGYGIATLGAISCVVALIVSVMVPQDLGFIDADTMLGFSLMMMGIGAVMVGVGQSYQR